MIPDLWSSRGESTTPKSGFYPGKNSPDKFHPAIRLETTEPYTFVEERRPNKKNNKNKNDLNMLPSCTSSLHKQSLII